MLRTLIKAGQRFKVEGVLPPTGYKRFSKPIRWIIHISPKAELIQIEQVDLDKPRPGRNRSGQVHKVKPSCANSRHIPRAKRTGKPKKDNMHPYLLVDEARFALSIPEDQKQEEARILHERFVQLLQECYKKTHEPDISVILKFLEHCPVPKNVGLQGSLGKVEAKDVVTFVVERDIPGVYLFQAKSVQEFWVTHLEREYISQFDGQCASCCSSVHLLQTLPLEVVVLGQKCQITSFNKEAFKHFGKDQTLNAPLCFTCGIQAAQGLNHLLKQETHHVILARENPKRGTQNPLRNQVAVFWMSRPEKVQVGEVEIDLEAVLKIPLDDPMDKPDAYLTQMEHFLQSPHTGREAALHIPDNRFYLTVLSANKARLVIREWIEASLSDVRLNLKNWFDAQRIVGPEGEPSRGFPLRRLVKSLYRGEDDSEANPNLVRGLLRTAFKGTFPPQGLLQIATLRFRNLTHSKDEQPRKRTQRLQQLHALAATMKLVLTYDKGGPMIQETLNLNERQPAYLCGRLFAILEETQRRASRGRVKATLTDRFYGAASSAPASTFTRLLKLTSTAHLPKLRKRWHEGYKQFDALIEEVMVKLDETGGFPRTLRLTEQSIFALGYYQQRAALKSQTPTKQAQKKE